MSGKFRAARRLKLAMRDTFLEDSEPEADDVPQDERIPIGPLDVAGYEDGLPIEPADWPLPTHSGLVDLDLPGLAR
jgi:hypothetical protein